MSDRQPSAPLPSEKPVVAFFRSPVFNASETFVQRQAIALVRYQPLMVGLEDKGNVLPGLKGRILLARNPAERLDVTVLGRGGGLARRLRPFAPTLIHAHFGTDGLLALPIARALGVPLVTTLHGYEVTHARSRMLLSGSLSWTRYTLFRRSLAGSGALFLAVSDAIRRRAIAQGFPAERTITHYVGVDLDDFRPEAVPAEPGLVLHVGRLVEKKGTAQLLDAFARVRRAVPDASLVVIGDGPLRPALERQSAALGLAGCVRFLGALPPDAIALWMRRAWLIAAPSVTARAGDSEGLPTVLVEAAACALPAVATDHSGIPEAVIDGRTGFVVPERDVEALAARCIDLLGSAELRHRFGQAARALAEERFDMARQTALLEDCYGRLREGG